MHTIIYKMIQLPRLRYTATFLEKYPAWGKKQKSQVSTLQQMFEKKNKLRFYSATWTSDMDIRISGCARLEIYYDVWGLFTWEVLGHTWNKVRAHVRL